LQSTWEAPDRSLNTGFFPHLAYFFLYDGVKRVLVTQAIHLGSLREAADDPQCITIYSTSST
jgi:hypothetical protein